MSNNKKIEPFWWPPSEPIYPIDDPDPTQMELEKNWTGPKCTFCFENGEPFQLWSSHRIRNSADETVCPILQKFKCQLCGQTGKNAHTRSYCPLKNNSDVKQFYGDQSFYNMMSLKHGVHNSAGRKLPDRYHSTDNDDEKI